jgi:energy-coupling factor transporter ATP-binding protein EcfA2
VAKALFDTAIAGVLQDKTRVLVLSSNYHLLAAADQVVVMDQGRVLGAGSYQALLPRFPKFFNGGAGGSTSSSSSPKEQGVDDGAAAAQERSLALSPIPGRQAITLEELGRSARLDRMESMPVLGGDKAGSLIEKEVSLLVVVLAVVVMLRGEESSYNVEQG